MKRPAVLLALILFALTTAMVAYRVIWLKYPVLPAAPGQVWDITIDALIRPAQGRISADIALPAEHEGRLLVEERISSGVLNFSVKQEGTSRTGRWSGAADGDAENISYRGTIIVRPRSLPAALPPAPEAGLPGLSAGDTSLMARLTAGWQSRLPEGRFAAVAEAAANRWDGPPPKPQDIRAWQQLQDRHGRPRSLMLLLNSLGIPARLQEGLLLEQGVQTELTVLIEAWVGKTARYLDPENGRTFPNAGRLLILSASGEPAVKVSSGELLNISWGLERQIISKWRMHFERVKRSHRFLDRWSLFSIPDQFQNIFRILLLVPVGALVICVLRNVIGLPSFGIFMPVLMALAFRSTGLLEGLGIFAGIMLIGYAARRYIDGLRLLLVPRLSVILTLVIICFTLFALLGGQFSVRALMGVGLLPMVILTMTVERFFVIIEEAGIRKAFETAAGSAVVASITYLIVQWETLQLTFFVYPELLLSVAGFQILLGRYTGYRVSELIRFRSMKKGEA